MNKQSVIKELRELANCKINELSNSNLNCKEKASLINTYINNIRITKINDISKENYSNEQFLSNVLLIYYCSFIVMLESRNKVWPYEYMTFARRIGELWEVFCKLPFLYPVRSDVIIYGPLSFDIFQQEMQEDMIKSINNLDVKEEQKEELIEKYNTVWSFVDSGNINLELDLHIKVNNDFYDIDYKSGFSSNEKGNTNRLLLVGKIFHSLKENHHTLLFVRQKEEDNNNYLIKLKKSKFWEVYCADNSYNKIKELSGFDLKKWINNNITWENDITEEFKQHLINNNLLRYLSW